MIWLLALLFPFLAQAAALPQPSDVVFLHDGVTEDKQDSYNYIFAMDGDATIYTCQANRCSLSPFRDQPTLNITFYQLPEGFQRVANVVDQGTLAEYRTAAVANYHFDGLETELSASSTTRSYHTVTIHSDGSYERDTTSQERNAPAVAENGQGIAAWIWWLVGGAVAVAAVIAWILWKRRS